MKTFDRPGPQNTTECLELASQKARDQGIEEIIIATTTGDTALKALARFQGMKIIAVNHHAGFKEPFKVEMPPENRKKLETAGAKIIIAAHVFSAKQFRL